MRMSKEMMYQLTRPEQDIEEMVEQFIESNRSVLEDMIVNTLKAYEHIKYGDLDEEEVLINRVYKKLGYE